MAFLPSVRETLEEMINDAILPYCHLCAAGNEYAMKTLLNLHIRASHLAHYVQIGSAFSVKCMLICTAFFNGEAHYHCTYCEFAAEFKSTLRYHVRMNHEDCSRPKTLKDSAAVIDAPTRSESEASSITRQSSLALRNIENCTTTSKTASKVEAADDFSANFQINKVDLNTGVQCSKIPLLAILKKNSITSVDHKDCSDPKTSKDAATIDSPTSSESEDGSINHQSSLKVGNILNCTTTSKTASKVEAADDVSANVQINKVDPNKSQCSSMPLLYFLNKSSIEYLDIPPIKVLRPSTKYDSLKQNNSFNGTGHSDNTMRMISSQSKPSQQRMDTNSQQRRCVQPVTGPNHYILTPRYNCVLVDFDRGIHIVSDVSNDFQIPVHVRKNINAYPAVFQCSFKLCQNIMKKATLDGILNMECCHLQKVVPLKEQSPDCWYLAMNLKKCRFCEPECALFREGIKLAKDQKASPVVEWVNGTQVEYFSVVSEKMVYAPFGRLFVEYHTENNVYKCECHKTVCMHTSLVKVFRAHKTCNHDDEPDGA